MVNIKTLKLSTNKIRGKISISDVKKINPSLKHFEPISEKQKEKYRKEIELYKEEIRNLNITEEMRKKKKSQLTAEEKDKLYNEYVYKSIVEASKSAIKYGTCDIKYLFQEIEEKFGVTTY